MSKTNNQSMIETKDLSFNYPKQQVINKISISVKQHGSLAILGPSGCGKTTLLNLIAGLLRPSSGSLVSRYKVGEVGFVFQDFRLLPWCTVRENIALVLRGKNINTETKCQRINEVLAMTGLNHFDKKYPYELSGGMQQRTGLARALVLHPPLLLMDEPFSAVDCQTRDLLIEEFKSIISNVAITRIMVTNNIDDALELANQLIIISAQPASIIRRIDITSALHEIGREALRQEIWNTVRHQNIISSRCHSDNIYG